MRDFVPLVDADLIDEGADESKHLRTKVFVPSVSNLLPGASALQGKDFRGGK